MFQDGTPARDHHVAIYMDRSQGLPIALVDDEGHFDLGVVPTQPMYLHMHQGSEWSGVGQPLVDSLLITPTAGQGPVSWCVPGGPEHRVTPRAPPRAGP